MQPQTELTVDLLSFEQARTYAARQGCRERVLAYVVRRPTELLVFAHTPGYSEAGIQVPAGGVEPGERPAETAVRETWEEAGLRLSAPQHLASYHWTRAGQSQIWHYYALHAPLTTPDTWAHCVTGGENDSGLTFQYHFAPLNNPGLVPGHGYEAALPHLHAHLHTFPDLPLPKEFRP